jgi:NADH-quinone oxidoreductase subunit G
LAGARWLGMNVTDIATLESVLIVGSNLRKEQPLLATRFRAAAKKGTQINFLHAASQDPLMRVAQNVVVKPSALPTALAAVAKALAALKGAALPSEVANAVANVTVTPEAEAVAKSLAAKTKVAIFLGHYAQQHAHGVALHVLAQEIARLAGGTLGFFGQAANSVGAEAIGAEPGAEGQCAQGMVCRPIKGYVLLNVEPEADCADPASSAAALKGAEFVVAMAMFKNEAALQYANVLLPIAPFSETAGTFVNMEGRAQSFNGVVKPLGQTRPAWKVIRVLGNLLGLAGFEQDNVEAIRKEIAPDLNAFVASKLNNLVSGVKVDLGVVAAGNEVAKEVGIYEVDSITRRAPSLQMTADAKASRPADYAEAAE